MEILCLLGFVYVLFCSCQHRQLLFCDVSVRPSTHVKGGMGDFSRRCGFYVEILSLTARGSTDVAKNDDRRTEIFIMTHNIIFIMTHRPITYEYKWSSKSWRRWWFFMMIANWRNPLHVNLLQKINRVAYFVELLWNVYLCGPSRLCFIFIETMFSFTHFVNNKKCYIVNRFMRKKNIFGVLHYYYIISTLKNHILRAGWEI